MFARENDLVNGRRVLTTRERYCLEHGYLKWYGRNTCKFVMSRAARRRGMTTPEYERRVKCYKETERLRALAIERGEGGP